MFTVITKPLPGIPESGFIGSFFKQVGTDIDSLAIFTSEDGFNWRRFRVPAWNGENGEFGHDFDIFKHGDHWFAPYTKLTYEPQNLGNYASFGLLRSTDLRTWEHWAEIDTNAAGLEILWSWAPAKLITHASAPLLTCSLTDYEVNGGTYPGNFSTWYFQPTSADLSTWGPATILTDGNLGLGNEFDNHFFLFQDGVTYGRIVGDGLSFYLATSSSPTNGYGGLHHIQPGGQNREGEGFTTFWLGEDHLGMIYKDYAIGKLVFTDSEDNGVTWSAIQLVSSLIDYDHGGVWKI